MRIENAHWIKTPIRHMVIYAMLMPCSEACMNAGIDDTVQLVMCEYPTVPEGAGVTNPVEGSYVDYSRTPVTYFVCNDGGKPGEIVHSLTRTGMTTAELGIYASLPDGYYFHPPIYLPE